MSKLPFLRIHTDGGSRGNPGEAAYAYTIERDGHEPIEEADRLGKMTNNQAEYTALVRALEHALELGPEHEVVVRSDSELMVKQMNGEYRVKHGELKPLYDKACALRRKFQGKVNLVHIRRAENSRADALANEALDGMRQATPRASMFALAPAPTTSATQVTRRVPALGLREEAIGCLRKAAESWAGGVLEPSPERVWSQLAEMLIRHGIEVPTTVR